MVNLHTGLNLNYFEKLKEYFLAKELQKRNGGLSKTAVQCIEK